MNNDIEEVSFDDLEQTEIKLSEVIANLDTKRTEFNVLDNILNPFKNAYSERMIKSPLFNDYVEFTTEWIPKKQESLKHELEVKIKSADKVLKQFNTTMKELLEANKKWQDEKQYSQESPINRMYAKFIIQNDPCIIDRLAENWKENDKEKVLHVIERDSWHSCKALPDCKKVENAWYTDILKQEADKYCVLKPNEKMNCDYKAPAEAFARDRSSKIKGVKDNLKQAVKDLTNERIELNKKIKTLRSVAKTEEAKMREREETDFDFWLKRHVKYENVKKYAKLLDEMINIPENRKAMVQRNKSALYNLAESAKEMLDSKPSAMMEKEYKEWENKLYQSEARFGMMYIKNKDDDSESNKNEIDEEKIEKDAERRTTYAIQDFLHKSVEKIGFVLQSRPDCNKFTSHIEPASLDRFNGTIKTECDNEDQFTTKNTLTYVNEYYKPSIDNMVRAYNKYPTTFVDVKFKKEKISVPSEEWMNTIFSKQ